MGTIYRTKDDVMRKAQEAKGRKLGDLDKYNRLQDRKGDIGQVLEESHFGYIVNSDARPDFEEAGVELKVTPFRKNKNGTISAKERLVLNIINYMTEHCNTFEESSFWSKNQCLQLLFYEYLEDVPKSEFEVVETIQYSYPEDDLRIIKDDWKSIIGKIKKGLAHQISESDTMYLGACTKGRNRDSVRPQPFSHIPARQRAYSLKQSYMTHLLRTYVFGTATDERIIKDVKQLGNMTFEEYVLSQLQPYLGYTQKELLDILSVNSRAKNVNELITAKILGVEGRISQTAEFMKAGIVPKTIRVDDSGQRIKESMSFPTFKFTELSQEEWETSSLKTMFDETRFLFIVFQFDCVGELVLRDAFFWNMPNDDLEEVREVWERTVAITREGIVLKRGKRGVENNLPKASESRVAHVRPHARDASDTDSLPDGRQITKQCFWLNNTYIMSQVRKHSAHFASPSQVSFYCD